jgi:thiosulfate/3-mercaptopyruvate sulfurtransferase
MHPLVTPVTLSTMIRESARPPVIIDTRNPSEYAVAHIPGAINIREIFTYLATSTPEGIASLQSEFAKLLGTAGITSKEPIVIYEDAMNKGFGQSCRGYFLLRYLGCEQVSVLHGGYQAWLAARLPIVADVPIPVITTFQGQINPAMMVTTAQMLAAVKDSNRKIVFLDVRDRTDIRVKVDLEGDASREALEELVAHSNEWSPVANTLRLPVKMDVSLA